MGNIEEYWGLLAYYLLGITPLGPCKQFAEVKISEAPHKNKVAKALEEGMFLC